MKLWILTHQLEQAKEMLLDTIAAFIPVLGVSILPFMVDIKVRIFLMSKQR